MVEISDSTPALDLKTKASLYARAAIVEYWVVDVEGRRVIVHRSPTGGKYTSVVAYQANEAVAPLSASVSEFRLTDILI